MSSIERILMKCHHYLLIVLVVLSTNTFAQHDSGRDAVKHLAKGDLDKTLSTIEIIKKKNNSPTSEAEKEFITMMVACKQGDLDKAYNAAKKAVANGLPISRLQAGPREILMPLYKHKAFKSWIKEEGNPLVHGPLVGSVTESSAQFWVRTARKDHVQIELSRKGVDLKLLSEKVTSLAEKDFTAIVKIESLKPNTEYEYQVIIKGKKVGKKHSFTTFPNPFETSKFQIAFGGGAGYTEEKERMWDTMNKFNPLATLLLGDNVYIDDPEHSLTDRYCYYRRQSQPEFRNYVATNSIYSIYDDHDFGDNDIVPGPETEDPSWKREVWNTFKQNWNNPSYGGGESQPGCWYDFYIGEVHFIMLDTRYYRDLENKNMLSDIQRKWLFETLKNSRGKFKVIASSVPWSAGIKPGSKDTWDGYSEERESIFSFIEEEKIEGILLMAADRHRSDFRKTPRPNGYDLYETMSSRLTNMHVHPLVENAVGSEFIMGYNEDCSFGLITYDTEKEDPSMTYQIININGEVVGKKTVLLSQLDFR